MHGSFCVYPVLLCACSSCTPRQSTASVEAGPSWYVPDRVDATAPDGPAGAASGASASDGALSFDGAAPDGAANPFNVGQWNPVPGLACGVLVAADPNFSVPVFQWTACATDASGCQRFDVNWPSPSMRKLGFTTWESVRIVNGQPLIHYWRAYSNNQYEAQSGIFVVETLSGNHLFAMGQFLDPNTSCLGVEAIGERGIAMALAHGAVPNNGYFTVWSSWSAANALSFSSHSLADFGLDSKLGQVTNGAVGAGPLFLELQGPDSVGVYDMDHDKFIPTSPRLVGEIPMAVSDGALAFEFSAAYGVDLIRPDGSWANVIVPTSPAPRRVSAYGVDRSNAQGLAWMESDYGNSWSNSVLWTSPYATSAAVLQPRKVAAIADALGAGGVGMVVNAGVVLNLVGKDKALVTRLSDGMGWLITAQPGDAFTAPLWVDDSEVWLAVGQAALSSWTASFTGIVRYSRSALGTPTVMPGI